MITRRPPSVRQPSSRTGILAVEARDHKLVSFDTDVLHHHQNAIRATAMVFEDPASQALRQDLDRVAKSDATILIVGETGTGKELTARYIHAQSARNSKPFVAFNCGALSDSLAEAELFGHEKGAFTGAIKTQPGWFEVAHGGTLMLDEIGDLPLGLQVKLLRVLQEREVIRVGSRCSLPVDVRVIAATNVDLDAAIEAKRFREDLYFRLNVARVHLQPLRERPADIAALASYFLGLYGKRLERTDLSFGPGVIEALQQHSWPGNIRELENVIHNAILLARTPILEASDMRLSRRQVFRETEPLNFDAALQRLVERSIINGETSLFDRTIRCLIRCATELANGNQVRAAANLGISRNSFRTHLSHLGLIPQRRRRQSPAPKLISALTLERKPGSRLTELRIGVQKYGTMSLLKARGSLEQRLEGLAIRVLWAEYAAGPQLLEALAEGKLDVCATGEAPPVFAQAAGTALLYIGYEPPTPRAEAFIVRQDSPILSVSDLRGKRVALNRGSNVHYLLVRALAAHDLSIDDIKPVYLPPNELLETLNSGNADAGLIWDPLLSAAQIQNGMRVLIDGDGLVANRQFYVASVPFVRENPAAVRILLEELRHAGEYAANHANEMALLMASEVSIEPRALEAAFGRLTYGAKAIDEGIIREQQEIADTFHALGILRSSISVREAAWLQR